LQNLSKEFLAYDTEGVYDLPKRGDYLILIFHKEGDENIGSNIFTTIRRRTPEKEKYYRENIGRIFNIDVNDNNDGGT
jgi:hypothetical protein